MTAPPDRPKMYHITHVDNLKAIVATGGLMSDAKIAALGGAAQVIGMSAIKKRRLEVINVDCHTGTKVGDYVPFYFCPRSVMLYLLHMANHPDLSYRGGQGPILHLEADLHTVTKWANANGIRWAFSLWNAGAYYAEFRSEVDALGEIDWGAVAAVDFRNAEVKERKQAEFLVYGTFPFELVESIGAQSARTRERAAEAVRGLARPPKIELKPDWYF